MVSISGGYYGLPFQEGYYGGIQGYHLSPTLFNVVVDAVIRHWVTVVAEIEAGTEVLGLLIQYFVPYFYSDNGLAASTQPERLQRVFTVLIGLFCQFGLRTNTRKTVSMACQPCHMPGSILVVVYVRLRRRTGLTFWEWHRMLVQCPECRVEVTAGLLPTHRHIQHYVGRPNLPPGEA